MKIKTALFLRKNAWMLRALSWIIALMLSVNALADSNKALKFLQKGEYDKLDEMLAKSIEKDSINPEARYFYSLFYTLRKPILPIISTRLTIIFLAP
ncbi:MAG: hypothetical protein U5K79_03795 [Cyclobacteriaceae bacterium]|nr:hypothetical protein [Cyclobacteriaceae bacterium]